MRDRIKKRKMNSKIGNEVQKLERIIMKKKGEGAEGDQEGSSEDRESEGEVIEKKRQ